MLNTLIRFGMGLIGFAMLLDVFLPQIHESATIDKHTISTRHDNTHSSGATQTDYTLHFFGSKIKSCGVGLNAFNATRDGDAIIVRHSKIFRHCTSIEKDGVNVYTYQGWRLFYAICGALSLLAAFGAFPAFEFEGRRIY